MLHQIKASQTPTWRVSGPAKIIRGWRKKETFNLILPLLKCLIESSKTCSPLDVKRDAAMFILGMNPSYMRCGGEE